MELPHDGPRRRDLAGQRAAPVGAKGEDILRKINTARQALAALQAESNPISDTAH
jgi:hypothetical protein